MPTAKNTSAIRSANKKRPNPNVGDWDAIDRNAGLSRDDKYHQRSETAAQAIADFEASKTLARAREAVELAVAKNDSPDGVGMLKAMKETERGWQRAMDKIAERADRTFPIRGDDYFSRRGTGCGEEAKARVGAIDKTGRIIGAMNRLHARGSALSLPFS